MIVVTTHKIIIQDEFRIEAKKFTMYRKSV